MKATEIKESTIQKSHCDWIIKQAKELKALISYESDSMIVHNKVRALSAISTMEESLSELKAYIAEKAIEGFSYVVKVHRKQTTDRIETIEILDVKNNRQIDFRSTKPALCWFMDESDMVESLSWNLNCHDLKTTVHWDEGHINGTVHLIG